MEILIVGGIVVALMVFVSTKIKKEAKKAYEREIFEGENFTIIKPEDFIIPVAEMPGNLFWAHSRDFGTEENKDFYQCTAAIKIAYEKTETAAAAADEQEIAEQDLSVTRKNLYDAKNKNTLMLEIKFLTEFSDQYSERIRQMLDSFRSKN